MSSELTANSPYKRSLTTNISGSSPRARTREALNPATHHLVDSNDASETCYEAVQDIGSA